MPVNTWDAQREQAAGPIRIRLMWMIRRLLGRHVAYCLCGIVILCAYPFLRAVRRELGTFHKRIPQTYQTRDLTRSFPIFRHLLRFAESMIDKIDACCGMRKARAVSIRQDANYRAFQAALKSGQGVFVITSHLGTAEMAVALTHHIPANRQPPHVHAFQALAHDAIFTRFLLAHLPQEHLSLHDTATMGPETPMFLSELLARGNIIMMAGDRLPPSHVPTRHPPYEFPFLNGICRLPQGVFTLANLLHAPTFAMTCVRVGDAYEMHVRTLPQSPDSPRAYRDFLEEETLSHPLDWHHFHAFFKRA